MPVSNAIDCNGLSAAPTVLRIKQALIGLSDQDLPLGVLIDAECDCERIASSLGTLAEDVYFATDIEQLPFLDGNGEVAEAPLHLS